VKKLIPLLSIFAPISYLAALLYEVGYLKSANIPFYFINLNSTYIAWMIIGTSSLIILMYIVDVVITPFYLGMRDSFGKSEVSYSIFKIFFIAILVLPFVMIGNTNILEVIKFSLGFLVLSLFYEFGMPMLFQHSENTLEGKMHAERQRNISQKSFTEHLIGIDYSKFFLMGCMVVLILLGVHNLGKTEANIVKDYPTFLVDNTKYVLLRKYNDQSIFLEVDNNNKYSSKFLVINFPRPYGRGINLFQTKFALNLFYLDPLCIF